MFWQAVLGDDHDGGLLLRCGTQVRLQDLDLARQVVDPGRAAT
jgi:hypothetical protein